MSGELNTLVVALASGGTLTGREARATGYDAHVLQGTMELVAPLLKKIGGYKPLRVYLRQAHNGCKFGECNTDLARFKNVLQVFEAFVRIDAVNPYATTEDVRVFVGLSGGYLVCTTTPVDTRDTRGYVDTYDVWINVCHTADDLARVLHQMRLQEDPYKPFISGGEVTSPLAKVAEGLMKAVEQYERTLERELNVARRIKGQISPMLSRVTS